MQKSTGTVSQTRNLLVIHPKLGDEAHKFKPNWRAFYGPKRKELLFILGCAIIKVRKSGSFGLMWGKSWDIDP